MAEMCAPDRTVALNWLEELLRWDVISALGDSSVPVDILAAA